MPTPTKQEFVDRLLELRDDQTKTQGFRDLVTGILRRMRARERAEDGWAIMNDPQESEDRIVQAATEVLDFYGRKQRQ